MEELKTRAKEIINEILEYRLGLFRYELSQLSNIVAFVKDYCSTLCTEMTNQMMNSIDHLVKEHLESIGFSLQKTRTNLLELNEVTGNGVGFEFTIEHSITDENVEFMIKISDLAESGDPAHCIVINDVNVWVYSDGRTLRRIAGDFLSKAYGIDN